MSGSCISFSKALNYIVNTVIFLLGALLAGWAIYVLVTDYRHILREWWIWVTIAAGIVLIILGLLGCGATTRPNRCFLAVFLLLAGAALVILCVAAVAASIHFNNVKAISGLNSPALNRVTGRDQDAYRFLRTAYGGIYKSAECRGGVCSSTTDGLRCSAITCRSRHIGDVLNGWLNTDPKSGVTSSSFLTCVTQTLTDKRFEGGSAAASAWCGSNTAVVSAINNWVLGVLIGLWVITAFVLFVCIGNCVLICGKKERKGRVIVAQKPAGAVYAQPVTGGVQVVHV